MNPEERHRIGLVQIHIAVLLASGAGLFAKLVPVSPMVLTAGRTAFGSLALLLFALFAHASLRLHSTRDLFAILSSGLVLAIHWFTFFLSIQKSSVAIALLAFATFPLFTTFLEPMIEGEPLRREDVLTAVLVSAGLVMVTPSFDLSDRMTQGLLWGIVSAFAFAVLSLMSRSYSGRYPAPAIAFYQQGFAALCTLPFALQWQGRLTAGDVRDLVILGLVFTALVQGLVVASLRHLRAQTASVVFGLEPVYGIVLAWLVIGEVPGVRTIAGGSLICGAVLWASFRHRRPAQTAIPALEPKGDSPPPAS
ncbi:MAG TPA: DMT family transporter [Telluria sp.]